MRATTTLLRPAPRIRTGESNAELLTFPVPISSTSRMGPPPFDRSAARSTRIALSPKAKSDPRTYGGTSEACSLPDSTAPNTIARARSDMPGLDASSLALRLSIIRSPARISSRLRRRPRAGRGISSHAQNAADGSPRHSHRSMTCGSASLRWLFSSTVPSPPPPPAYAPASARPA